MRPRSLINAFVIRCLNRIIVKVSISEIACMYLHVALSSSCTGRIACLILFLTTNSRKHVCFHNNEDTCSYIPCIMHFISLTLYHRFLMLLFRPFEDRAMSKRLGIWYKVRSRLNHDASLIVAVAEQSSLISDRKTLKTAFVVKRLGEVSG